MLPVEGLDTTTSASVAQLSHLAALRKLNHSMFNLALASDAMMWDKRTIGTEGSANMTFNEARDLAIEFGAKLPKFDHTAAVAQCWIDRVEAINMAANRGLDLVEWVDEANRYAGA